MCADLYWLAFPDDRLQDVRNSLAAHDLEAHEIRRRTEEGGDVVTLEVWGMTPLAFWWDRRRFEKMLRAIADRHGAALMRQRLRVLHQPYGSWYAPIEDR